MSANDGEEGGGEGYFASASDLMVGVLFIFLLMLTVFAMNFRDAEAKQDGAKADYEQLVKDLAAERKALKDKEEEVEALLAEQRRLSAEAIEQRRAAEAQREAAERQAALNKELRELLSKAVLRLETDINQLSKARSGLLDDLVKTLKEEHGIEVKADPASGVLHVGKEVLAFKSKEHSLTASQEDKVQRLAQVLQQKLKCLDKVKSAKCNDPGEKIFEAVFIEGHTDSDPFTNCNNIGGTNWIGGKDLPAEHCNDLLSSNRALNVFRVMMAKSLGLRYFKNIDEYPLLAFAGYGERRPRTDVALGDKEQQRRIDIRFVLASRTPADVKKLLEDINNILKQP